MKSFLIIIAFFTYSFLLKAQSLSFQFGTVNFPEKSEFKLHPDINNQLNTNSSQNFFKINYEHSFKKKLLITTSFSRYPLSTYFKFQAGKCANRGVGWTGTNVTRTDFSIMYNIFYKSKFITQPYIGLGILKSTPNGTGSGRDLFGQWVTSIQPNVRVLKDVEAEAFSNFQVVPVVGLKFGYAFWGRLELFFDFHEVFGHKIIQELRMSYSYKGVEQPEAVNYSDGSGRFYALGLGYRFVKPKVK